MIYQLTKYCISRCLLNMVGSIYIILNFFRNKEVLSIIFKLVTPFSVNFT